MVVPRFGVLGSVIGTGSVIVQYQAWAERRYGRITVSRSRGLWVVKRRKFFLGMSKNVPPFCYVPRL